MARMLLVYEPPILWSVVSTQKGQARLGTIPVMLAFESIVRSFKLFSNEADLKDGHLT